MKWRPLQLGTRRELSKAPDSRIRAPYGPSRRPQPQDALLLRSQSFSWASDCEAAAGASLPHTHSRVFAEGQTRESLHQLATGSAKQLPCTIGLSGADQR